MDGQKSKGKAVASSKAINVNTTTASNTIHVRHRIVENFLLIWVDASIDESSKDAQNTLGQLRNVVGDVNIFTEIDKCVDFLSDVKDMKVFLIIEGYLGQKIVPFIHDIPQLDTAYIFCNNKFRHEPWTKQWVKIKGVHTSIRPICEALQIAVKQCNQDYIAVSFVPVSETITSQNLDQLEPSFMYTQIFKEILLEMEYDKRSIRDFTAYCRHGNYGPADNITRFENEYHADSAIWWYTYPSFIYSMLNGALRLLEGGTIISMGFFIHDLYNQIEQLYRQQVSNYKGKAFTVYRGQGLSTTDFEKLRKTKGGLMSFNNFLSTSTEQEVSLRFCHKCLNKN